MSRPISPEASASGTNSSGPIAPSAGCVQRASASTPLGVPVPLSTFGWPLVVAGSVKIAYDLLLLAFFGKVRPPEERREAAPAS